MHKVFKEACRGSNKVDAISQIITTCSRDHKFAMMDLTVKGWSSDKENRNLTWGARKCVEAGEIYLKLDGKIDLGILSAIAD